MAESRFERYVKAQVHELTKAKRDELEKRVEEIDAQIETQINTLREIADEGLRELNARIDAQATKFGWHVKAGSDPVVEANNFSGECHDRYRELVTEYDYDNHRKVYMSGPAREAEQALEDFDESVEKAATRLVVLKMDLGMKADAFDAAVAEAVEKLLK
jgi:hypothetical protein